MINSCFVLMPIGKSHFDEYYEKIIKPTITKMNINVTRADEIYGTRPIIDDIFEAIEKSDIIIADITGNNPNVLYELGIAHALNKFTIIITKNIHDIPFDFHHIRIIQYEPENVNFSKKLGEDIQQTIIDASKKTSNFFRTFPSFLNFQIPNENGYWKTLIVDYFPTRYADYYELLGLIPLSSINNATSYYYNESHWLRIKSNSKVKLKKNDIVKFKFNYISDADVFYHGGKTVLARNIYVDDHDIKKLTEE